MSESATAMSGRLILNMGKEAAKNARKVLAFHNAFMQDGHFPSGMNEDDYHENVIEKALLDIKGETNSSIEIAAGAIDDVDEEEEETAEEREGSDAREKPAATARGRAFVGLIPFLIMGPRAPVGDQSPLLDPTSDVPGGRKEQRAAKKKQDDFERANDPNRGVSMEHLKSMADVAQRDETAARYERDRHLLCLDRELTSVRKRMKMEIQWSQILVTMQEKRDAHAKYMILDSKASELEAEIKAFNEKKRESPEAVTAFLSMKKIKT